MNFDLLPTELKTHVFSFLPVYDLHLKVAKVSKHWKALSRDRFLVQHIEIDDRFKSNEIAQCLTDYTSARSLKIFKIDQFDWVYDIPVNNKLRRLHFDDCQFDPMTLEFLSTRFPSVSKIKLSKCEYQTDDDDDTSISVFLRFNKDFVRFFAGNCHTLEEFVIESYRLVYEESFKTLITKHGTTLKKICLRGNLLTDENFNALSKCRQVTVLQLFSLQDATESQLLSIKKLRSLRKLSIKGAIRIPESVIVDLLTTSPFPHLQFIYIRHCQTLSDDGVTSISTSYPNLKSLGITCCLAVTDAGISSVINNCSVLESLDLSINFEITGHVLTGITSRLPLLKYLNISGCTKILDNDFFEHQLQHLGLTPGLMVVHTDRLLPPYLED